MELKVKPNVELIDDKFIIRYDFNTNETIMGNNDTLLITSELVDVLDVLKFEDNFIGDVLQYDIMKYFRISNNGYNYSEWTPLTIENIKAICGYDKLYIQFKYNTFRNNSEYSLQLSPISKPNNEGWFQLHTTSGFYSFFKDYPTDDSLEYTLGFGTQGQLHYNDVTNRFHYKNNGYWSSPYTVQRNETTAGISYVPIKLGEVYLSDETIANASTGGFVPINDYVLTKDIRFGKDLANSVDSTKRTPKKGDYIFINSLTQGIDLQGVETLFINHIPSEIIDPKVSLEYILIETMQNIPVVDGTVEPLLCLKGVGDQVIFKPNIILKAFKIDSYCLVTDGLEGTNCCGECLDIKFRYSTTTRYWESQWLPLTQPNLRCIRTSPLKFFYIEFLFTQTCDNGGKPICITDLLINGEYQNISNDNEQLNRFGLRPDCNYALDTNGTTDNVYNGENIPAEWKDDDVCQVNNLFNPYDMNLTNTLNEKLANDITTIFGHTVEYYKVEANNAGVDTVLHEYQTYDTVQKECIKIMLPDNVFPEDQVGFNMFDLALFDSFTIHITRKEFHSKFGIGVRPGHKDYLYFCVLNKWFEVEHAQSFKEYNNMSIYYKVTLTKKSDDKNIDNRSFESEFNGLIKNNSLDNLFQKIVEEDEDKVVNKQIQENLTESVAENVQLKYDDNVIIEGNVTDYKKPDPINLSIYAVNKEYDLMNGSTIISRNYYDFTNRTNNNAIIYQRLDNMIEECQDRSFMVWFNIRQYVTGQVYNMIHNYNNITKSGYKIDFIDGRFEIVWFGQFFDIDVSIALNKWYSILVNFNQKQGKLEFYLYTRTDDGVCTTDVLELLKESVMDLLPSSYDGDLVLSVKGSPMNWTNMRIFNEIIPKSKINLTLNQYIIKHTELLIIADNALPIVIAPHWKL